MDKKELIKAAGKFLVVADFADPNTIKEYTLDRIGKSTYVGSHGKDGEQTFLAEFCWPIQVREELTQVCIEIEKQKKKYDNSFKLIYILNNKITNGEVTT